VALVDRATRAVEIRVKVVQRDKRKTQVWFAPRQRRPARSRGGWERSDHFLLERRKRRHGPLSREYL